MAQSEILHDHDLKIILKIMVQQYWLLGTSLYLHVGVHLKVHIGIDHRFPKMVGVVTSLSFWILQECPWIKAFISLLSW